MEANDMKALRDALVQTHQWLERLFEGGNDDSDIDHIMSHLQHCRNVCASALAAPPRNCDLYKTKEEAQEAFLKEPCDHPCGNCWVEDINNECGVEWLLATAAEQKGQENG